MFLEPKLSRTVDAPNVRNCGCVNGATLAICIQLVADMVRLCLDMHPFMPAPSRNDTCVQVPVVIKHTDKIYGRGVSRGGGASVTHNETCYCGAKGMGGMVTVYYTAT